VSNEIVIGIIGSSIQYSLSPTIHEYWMNENKIKGKYKIYDLKEEELKNFIKNIHNKNIKGLNVTIPYKKKIIDFIDEISLEAKIIGAVNTLIIKKNGKIYGDNTDAKGFINNLESIRPDWKERKDPIVILGAGGAARAIIYSILKKNKSNIRIINRNKDRAKKLIYDMKKIFPDTNFEYYNHYGKALKKASFLINASSLGMIGHPKLNINLEVMNKSSIIYDIVYSPLETNLLKQAKKLNFLTIDGLGMLLEQAAPVFNAWFNKKVCVNEELRKKVIKKIKDSE
tara:strand:- start:27406 stop:28260 length:855 start_codon:yes stop_codon:yes gene_type:complete